MFGVWEDVSHARSICGETAGNFNIKVRIVYHGQMDLFLHSALLVRLSLWKEPLFVLTGILFEVLFKVVVMSLLVLYVAGIGRRMVADEKEEEDDEDNLKDEQRPEELGLGHFLTHGAAAGEN
jgi:hypothetical protein